MEVPAQNGWTAAPAATHTGGAAVSSGAAKKKNPAHSGGVAKTTAPALMGRAPIGAMLP